MLAAQFLEVALPRGDGQLSPDPLARRVRAGDATAFCEFVDRYDCHLRRVALSVTSSRALAHRAVKETWTELVSDLDGLEPADALRTWAFRILLSRSQPPKDVPAPDGPAVGAASFSEGRWIRPPAPLDVEERTGRLTVAASARLLDALDGLADGERAVVILRDVGGLGADEVARGLGISVHRQSALLHHARAALCGAHASSGRHHSRVDLEQREDKADPRRPT